MATEIERKFLLRNDDWLKSAHGKLYQQGYLSTEKKQTVRVRTIEEKGFLTIKGASTGISRSEFEYEIPLKDAQQMLAELCHRPIIKKTRYCITYENMLWEIDEFAGENAGLIVAEIELESESQKFIKPPWIGTEVSDDPRYFNANLIKNPYTRW